jgi:hypothetical protein
VRLAVLIDQGTANPIEANVGEACRRPRAKVMFMFEETD